MAEHDLSPSTEAVDVTAEKISDLPGWETWLPQVPAVSHPQLRRHEKGQCSISGTWLQAKDVILKKKNPKPHKLKKTLVRQSREPSETVLKVFICTSES